MGVFHMLEDSSTGYSIDISLPLDKVAIEIDGPTHLSRTTFQTLGKTLFKKHQLQLMGWKVINIRFFEWDMLTSTELRVNYLRIKLQPLLKA